jgi:hypothetical protein
MVVQSVDAEDLFSLLLHLEAPGLNLLVHQLQLSEGGSHDCRSASLGGLERSVALEERRFAKRLRSFQSIFLPFYRNMDQQN